jgi:hypothetical protein
MGQPRNCPGLHPKTVTGIMTDIVLANSGFHTLKNFSENYPKFWHTPSERFASPVLGQKMFKEYRFEGAPHY